MIAASTPSLSTAVHITSLQSCGFLHSSRKLTLCADRAILLHVAARLPHQPDGRVVDGLAAAGAEEQAVVPGGRRQQCRIGDAMVARSRQC